MAHNGLTETEAWLYFLSSARPSDILLIIEKYPFFRELYQDIVRFRYPPKELITMFSDALRIMDENTVKYMVDEMKAELAQQKMDFERKLQMQKEEMQRQAAEAQKKDLIIDNLRARLAQYEGQNARSRD